MRRVLPVAAALALAACTATPAPAPPPTTTTTIDPATPITVATLTLPPRFDPTDTDDPAVTRVAGLLQRGLFRYDAKGKAVPEVAESVKTTDARVYRVTLAPGWTFSNGQAVTADSFVDAWSRAADPARPRLRRELFAPIAGFVPTAEIRGRGRSASPTPTATGRPPRLTGLVVTGPRSFTITLTRPVVGFEQRLGHVAFAPLPEVAFTDPAAFAAAPVGNGPYLLDGRWNEGGMVRLRPSARYVAEDRALNAGLDFRTYTDPTAALGDVEAGRLDVLDTLPTAALAEYRDTFGVRAVDQPVGRTLDLVVPVDRAPWTGPDGIARRTAISTAIDRDSLAEEVYAGIPDVATDLAAPVVEGHSRTVCGDLCTTDATAAAAALEQAGGIPGGVTIAYATDADQGPAATALCHDVTTTLHVTCTPRAYPNRAALRAAVTSGAEPGPWLSSHLMDYPRLESFLTPRFSPGAGVNTSGWVGSAFDTALDKAMTLDPAERTPRLHAAERLVLADLPVIPLLDVHATGVSSTAVTDVRYDVFGAPVYTRIRRGPATP